jgi:ADP-heptose:LPS heptosyltransferase
MKTAVLLSYKGLGSNLLHLAYCHELAKKFGPITVITLCKNLDQVIAKDPLIKEVIYLNEYNKKFFDILNLSKFLKKQKLENIFIYYPSIRYYIASKLAKIKQIHIYPLFKKKNLHLVNAAKKFTESTIKIENCPTETNIFIDIKDQQRILKKINVKKKNIVLGIGSSGPTTRWGSHNFINLIKKLNKKIDCDFYLLCGPEEKEISDIILQDVNIKNCITLCDKTISEIIPLLSNCNLYIGNDSFGHHVTSQCSIPSLVIMLDTPRAYTDYSKNQFRILPKNINENDISHNSNFSPDMVDVDEVLAKSLSLLN